MTRSAMFRPARRPFTVTGTATAGTCLSCRKPPAAGPLVIHTAPAEGLHDPMTMCALCTARFYGQTARTVRAAVRAYLRGEPGSVPKTLPARGPETASDLPSPDTINI